MRSDIQTTDNKTKVNAIFCLPLAVKRSKVIAIIDQTFGGIGGRKDHDEIKKHLVITGKLSEDKFEKLRAMFFTKDGVVKNDFKGLILSMDKMSEEKPALVA